MVGEIDNDGGMQSFDVVGNSFGGVACNVPVDMDMLTRACGSDKLHGKYSRSSPVS